MRTTVKLSDATVSFEDDPATHKMVYDTVLKFFKKHECFSGESVFQTDGPQVEGPELLAELTDKVFKFDVEWDIR